MPRATTRSFLRKTLTAINAGAVAPGASVSSMETADQELQIKKVMISGGADQGAALTFMLLPPGEAVSETNAQNEQYLVYRFGLFGPGSIVDFLDKPAIRVPEGYSFGILVHNYSAAAAMDAFVQCVAWHYPV